MSICKNQFIQKMYHIFQQACNALLVNMLKAGRWLFYLPAIYQHGTARINWVLTCYPLIVSFFLTPSCAAAAAMRLYLR